jgi:hypothetical protein
MVLRYIARCRKRKAEIKLLTELITIDYDLRTRFIQDVLNRIQKDQEVVMKRV